jgi:hypothetical protein
MRATYLDEPPSPHPLLQTDVMSDFSRNFRELQKARETALLADPSASLILFNTTAARRVRERD